MDEELRDTLEHYRWLISTLECKVKTLEDAVWELEQKVDRLEASDYNSLENYTLGR
jgi:predicted nuclease with TOPRIM domain